LDVKVWSKIEYMNGNRIPSSINSVKANHRYILGKVCALLDHVPWRLVLIRIDVDAHYSDIVVGWLDRFNLRSLKLGVDR
jgi:hypothetical protein